MAADKFLSNHNVTMYDHDPNDADANAVAWVPMKDYYGFVAAIFRSVGTGANDTLKIQAATDSSGTNATDVISYSGSDPDAVGDYIFLETDAQEIQGASDSLNFTHVALVVEFATSTDEAVVTYIRTEPRYAGDAETADSVA